MSGGNPHGFVWFLFGVAPAPFFVVFAVFSAGETQIWPGDLRVVAVAVFCLFLLFLCCASVVKPKSFIFFAHFFYRFSHCQDRALERDRPQQRKKKSAPGACGEPCFCVVFAFLAWPCTGSPKVQAILHGFGTSAKKRLPVRLTELAQYGWVGGWGPRYLAHKRERGPARVPRLLSEGKSASAR